MAKSTIKEARKAKIVDAALRVFAKKGFSEANVADISREAGVSTPVLYEYFKTKEEMLFAIPEKYTEEPVRHLEDILVYFRGPEHKIRAIVQGYMTLYEQNPLYSALVMLHLKTNRNFLKTKAYQTVRRIAGILLHCINEGVDKGVFKTTIDPFLIRSMILGTIEHLCIRKLLLGSPADLMVFVEPMIDTILDGIRTQPKQLSVNLSLTNMEMLKGMLTDTSTDTTYTSPKSKKASKK